MTKKYSVKDLVYLGIMSFLGLSTMVLSTVFIFTSDIQGLQNDSQRVSDFLNINSQVSNYIATKGEFPDSIKELDSFYPYNFYYSSNNQKSIYIDPKSKSYYELKYSRNTVNYQLCTEFQVGSERINYNFFEFEKGNNCVTLAFDYYSQQILRGEVDPKSGKPLPVERLKFEE